MMDELLAHMAEKKTVLRQKINEFIGAVRAWLRDHGFAKLAEYGNTDLLFSIGGRNAVVGFERGRPFPPQVYPLLNHSNLRGTMSRLICTP